MANYFQSLLNRKTTPTDPLAGIKPMGVDTTVKKSDIAVAPTPVAPVSPVAKIEQPATLSAGGYSTLKDYYQNLGQSLPGISDRAKTYESLGLGKATDYIGDKKQNITLLNKLQAGVESKPVASLAPTESKRDPITGEIINPTAKDIADYNKTTETTDPYTSLYSKIRTGLGIDKLTTKSGTQIYDENMAGLANEKTKLSALDTRLDEANKALKESEDDIRKRITASGGIVTESQVQRLVASEKSPLVNYYNDLLAERNKMADTIKDSESTALERAKLESADETAKRTDLNNQLTALLNLGEKDIAAKAEAIKTEAEAAKGKYIGMETDDNGNVTVITQKSDGTYSAETIGQVGKKTKATGTGKAAGGTTGQLYDTEGNPIDLNASQVTALSGFNDTIDGTDNAMELLNTGVKTGPLAAINLTVGKATGAGLSDTTTKGGMNDQLKLEQALSQIKANFMKAISGAAVSDSETKRLSAFLPTISDQEQVIKTKLTTLKAEMEKSKANFMNTMGAISGGESAGAGKTANIGRITVQDAEGNQFTIPADQLNEAIAEGYTKI